MCIRFLQNNKAAPIMVIGTTSAKTLPATGIMLRALRATPSHAATTSLSLAHALSLFLSLSHTMVLRPTGTAHARGPVAPAGPPFTGYGVPGFRARRSRRGCGAAVALTQDSDRFFARDCKVLCSVVD